MSSLILLLTWCRSCGRRGTPKTNSSQVRKCKMEIRVKEAGFSGVSSPESPVVRSLRCYVRSLRSHEEQDEQFVAKRRKRGQKNWSNSCEKRWNWLGKIGGMKENYLKHQIHGRKPLKTQQNVRSNQKQI